MSDIAAVFEAKGDYTGALENYNEVLKIDEVIYGRKHSETASDLYSIGKVLHVQGNYAEAIKTYDEAFAIRLQNFGPKHLKTKAIQDSRDQAKAELLIEFSLAFIKFNQPDSALICLQQALPLAQQLNEQETLGTLYNNLGAAYKLKQDWPQALQWLEKSVAHNRSVLGDSASVLAYTYFHLAGVAHAQGQSERAREYAQKSLALAARNKLAELRKEAEALLRQVK